MYLLHSLKYVPNILCQIAPNVVLTDEEIEMKMKFEYQQYLKDEYTFLRELGLLKDEEEELPEV